MATGPAPPRLREDLDSLTALVRLAAEHLGLDAAFLEKDFWVTELLRAIAVGDYVTDANGNRLPVTTVTSDLLQTAARPRSQPPV